MFLSVQKLVSDTERIKTKGEMGWIHHILNIKLYRLFFSLLEMFL